MKKIMIVDDEKDFCSLMKGALEERGFKVSTYSDSGNTLNVIRAFAPDLLILDIMMPGKSGIDVASELKGNKATRDIPIIFLSALVGAADENRNKNISGMTRYISKPARIEDILAAINSLLSEPPSSSGRKAADKVRIVTFLSREQVDFLDQMGKDALFHNGSKLSRSEILYELVSLLIALGVDVKNTDLSDGLARGILKKLRK